MPRIAGGKSRYLPDEHKLHGNFNFEGDDKARYQAFLHSDIYSCKSINDVALTQLQLLDEIYALIDNIGWRKVFCNKLPLLC